MSARARVKQQVESHEKTTTQEETQTRTSAGAASTASRSASVARLSTADLASVVGQRYALTRADAAHVISDRLVKALLDGEAVGFIKRLEGDQVELRILSIEDIAAEAQHGSA